MEEKNNPQFRIIEGGKGEKRKFNFGEFYKSTGDIADPIGPPPEETELEKLIRKANEEGKQAEKEAEKFRKGLGIREKPQGIDNEKYGFDNFAPKQPKTNLPVKKEKKEGKFSKFKKWILALLGISAVTAGAVGISAGVAGTSQNEDVKEEPKTEKSFTEELKYDPYKAESNSELSMKLKEISEKLENGELTEKDFLFEIASINDDMIKGKLSEAYHTPESQINLKTQETNGEKSHIITIRRKKIHLRNFRNRK